MKPTTTLKLDWKELHAIQNGLDSVHLETVDSEERELIYQLQKRISRAFDRVEWMA